MIAAKYDRLNCLRFWRNGGRVVFANMLKYKRGPIGNIELEHSPEIQ